MLDNIIFSVNATMPIFAMMLLGMFLRKVGLLSPEFAGKLNSFVFKVPLPALLFYSMAQKDIYTQWDTKFILFSVLATIASIILCVALSLLLNKKTERGEFIQSSYRSSASILGVQLAENIYGSAGMVPIMILGAVPIYNIVAVAALILTAPGQENAKIDKAVVKKTVMGIVKNPIILGILAGLVWSLLRLPIPTILDRTLEYTSRCATPLGLLALGASFEIGKARDSLLPALGSAFLKLFGLGIIFMPIAVYMGFRGEALMAFLVMLCSPATVTCYTMAREYGHDGTLSALSVMLGTIASAFTFALWLFILRTMGVM